MLRWLKVCFTVQDNVSGNAADGAVAAKHLAEPAPQVASQLFFSDMGPPARKTASMAQILKSRAQTKAHKAPITHLQQRCPSQGNSRAGVQSTEAGPSGATDGAAAVQAGKQQAARPPTRQVVCGFHLPCHACRLKACPAEPLSTVHETEYVQGRHLHCRASA